MCVAVGYLLKSHRICVKHAQIAILLSNVQRTCLLHPVLKPIICQVCSLRFSDKNSLATHSNTVHVQGHNSSLRIIDPDELSVASLKEKT